MKKLFKKSLVVLLSLVMVVCYLPLIASAETYSGTCGDNLMWTIDTSTGMLNITGTGAMDDYDDTSPAYAPWHSCWFFIKTVNIADGVTSIGNYAFYYYSALTNITIPDSVTSIGEGAFEYCESLTSITIPDSVTTIGEYAFCYCESLTSVTIPDSVMTISEGAFHSCESLTSVAIPDSVTTIGAYAFRYCDSLTSITIPNNVTTIDSLAFASCDSLTSITVDENNKKYSSNDYGVLFNKDKTELIQYPIGDSSTSYTIPDSVTTVGYGAFYSSDLESITIPDSVTTIDAWAFHYCKSFTSITIPDSVTTIGSQAFYGCESLISVTLPDSVTSIGGSVFYNTGYYNDSDNWVNDVLYIGNHFIKAKTTLSGSYTIKDGTLTIAGYSFEDCTSLTSITIPNSVTSIGKYAFFACESLTSVTIPDSVTSIGGNAFTNTEYYKNSDNWDKEALYIGKHLIKVKNPLSGSYVIKDGTLTIADTAFYASIHLTGITIPNSVITIGNEAFYYCKRLTSIIIPDGVTTIDGCAFYECYSLENVHIPDTVTEIGEDILSLTPACICSTTEDCCAKKYADEYGIEFKVCTGHNGYTPNNPDEPTKPDNSSEDQEENAHIINMPSKSTVNYGETLVLTIGEIEIPEDYAVKWFVEGTGVSTTVSEDGLECRVTSIANGSATIYAKLVDEEENVVINADGEEIFDKITLVSKAGFWQKFISFFKNLFGINRVIY